MREGRSYRTPEALWRPYLLLLFIVVLLLVLLLLHNLVLSVLFVLFVLVNNSGISVPVLFLLPTIVIVSLHASFSLWWFGPEIIEHD